MPVTHLNGIDVYHERWGEGPSLRFLNGSGATLDGMRLLLDGIAPLSNSEAIAAVIPGAELRVYEGGHAFFVQDRRAMPEILDFLGG